MFITLIFLFFLGTQVFFFLFFFAKLIFHKEVPQEDDDAGEGVSVIVAARNEKDNLERLLPALLCQKYRLFEIIIADDRSSDGTNELLAGYTERYENLRSVYISEVPANISPKKNALAQAIGAARFPNLLFTDADCLPASEKWIGLMTQELKGEKDIVLGYSPYRKEKGLLNMLIRYETLYTGILYLSFALRGYPYMGVGRNMAFKKRLFTSGKGYKSHAEVVGGDDDLFIQENADRQNTAIQTDPESSVISIPKRTWKEWMRQKWRHLAAGRKYSLKYRFMLGSILLSHTGFYFMLPLLIIQNQAPEVIAGFALRTIVLITIFTIISYRLNDKIKWIWLPLLDILYLFFFIIVGIKAALFKKNSWT